MYNRPWLWSALTDKVKNTLHVLFSAPHSFCSPIIFRHSSLRTSHILPRASNCRQGGIGSFCARSGRSKLFIHSWGVCFGASWAEHILAHTRCPSSSCVLTQKYEKTAFIRPLKQLTGSCYFGSKRPRCQLYWIIVVHMFFETFTHTHTHTPGWIHRAICSNSCWFQRCS